MKKINKDKLNKIIETCKPTLNKKTLSITLDNDVYNKLKALKINMSEMINKLLKEVL